MTFSPTALVLSGALCLGGAPVPAQTAKHAVKHQAAPPAPVQGPSVEGITEYRLANGLKVLLFPDPSKPNVTVNITYLVGSRNESYGETGMAHLLEHMLFKGTPRHPDIPAELTLHGADPNGTTSYDRTNYFESMKASDENLDWALDLEADRMVNSWIGVDPALAAEKLKTEMTVVRNEFEMNENDPMTVLEERVLETAYIWHNYGKPTIGCRADIENVDIHRLSAFFRTYYQPDNAVLMVAGKFDPARTLARINARFGAIPRPPRTLQRTYTVEPTQDGERGVTVRRVGDTRLVLAGYHIPSATHPDFPALSILAGVLQAAPSGRLYKALVAPGKAAQVFASAEEMREPGMFLAGARVRPDGNQAEAKDLVLTTLEGPGAGTFAPEEVDRAKTEILKHIDLMLNQSNQVGLVLSESIANGDWRTFFLYRDRVQAVTPADVARVAKAYLKPSNRTLGLFEPTSAPDRAEIPPMPDVEAMVRDYKGRTAPAQGEAFDVSPAAIEARTVRFTTASGLKVVLVPKRTRGGSVTLALDLHFGTEAALMNQGLRGGLTGSMLSRGTRTHGRQAFKDRLDKLKANARFSGSAEGVKVSLETVKESLPEAFALVAEALREPAFDAQEFETLRQQVLASVEAQRTDPQALAGTAYRRMLNLWPKGHPRYVTTLDETLEELKAVRLEDVKAFHAAFYGASDGELAIVGDVDPAGARAMVDKLLGAWKSPAPYARIIAAYRPVPAAGQVIETPDKANAVVLAGCNLDIKESDPDFAALELGDFMLGGGFLNSRLATRIRVNEGLSYGVGSDFRAGALDRFGNWTFYAICAPQNAAKVEASFRDEMAKTLAEGFTDKEIADAKSGWLQSGEQERAQDQGLAEMLVRNAQAGRTLAFEADLERKVAALKGPEIVAALRKYLKADDLCKVKAGDFKGAPLN